MRTRFFYRTAMLVPSMQGEYNDQNQLI